MRGPSLHIRLPGAEPEDAPFSGFHGRLAFYSGGGLFLDGYVFSIIGVALIQAAPALHLSPSWQGLIGASSNVGIFFGGFAGGWLTDKYGRQVLYTLDVILIIVCSAAQFYAGSALWLFILRLLIGVAVGADYPIATALPAEFAPRRYRGPLLGGLIALWFTGAAAAYLVGELLLYSGPDGWPLDAGQRGSASDRVRNHAPWHARITMLAVAEWPL